jgi:hypothetical protein
MQNSFTSPVAEDLLDENNEYSHDCYNIDLCKIKCKQKIKFSCLMGAKGSRCTLDEKVKIRDSQ